MILALVGVAVTLASVLVQSAVVQSRGIAHEVAVAGRQRMLSQRIALVCVLQASASPEQRSELRAELDRSIDEMAAVRDGLAFGAPALGLRGGVAPLGTSSDAPIARFLERARRARRFDECGSHPKEALALGHAARGEVVPALDITVHTLAAEAEASLSRIYVVAIAATVAIFLLLGAHQVWVVRPAIADRLRMGQALDDLRHELQQKTTLTTLLIDKGDDGVVTVEPGGAIGTDHSRSLERRFGPMAKGEPFTEWLRRSGASIGREIESRWDEACRTLNFTVLPNVLEHAGKTYDLRYRPLLDEGRLRAVCLVIGTRR